MPDAAILVSFFLAASVFAYMPGPSTLYAAAQTLARGRRAGWFAALGIHLGGYVHVVAAAFGLAILFQAVPVLFYAFKIIGGVYLIWIGISLFRTRGSTDSTQKDDPSQNGRRAFWQSVSVEILNPKTAMFYIAFLPQFTDPTASFAIWAQLLILGTIVNLMFSSADVLCVVLADRIHAYFGSRGDGPSLLNYLGAGVLIALGLRLLLAD